MSGRALGVAEVRRIPAGLDGPVVRCLNGNQYHVVGLEEQSPLFMTRARAQAWLDRHAGQLSARPARRERHCLNCNGSFLSQGPHNRLCDACRRLDAGPVPANFVRPDALGGRR
jgi:hypothetical protein